MIVLWRKLFIQKCFSKNGMTMRTSKKNLRKESWERTSGTTKWYKLGQVGVRGTSGTRRRGSSDLSGTSGTRRRGSSDLRGTSGTRTSGLSTWTIPLVPNGTTRPWTISDFEAMLGPWRFSASFRLAIFDTFSMVLPRSYLAPSEMRCNSSRPPHGLKIRNSGQIYSNSYITQLFYNFW